MRQARSWIDRKLIPGTRIQLPDSITRHLVQVLRLRRGDECILFNGRDGRDYRSRILQIDKQQVVAEILAQTEAEAEADFRIHLILGISRGERMDFAIQKAVELGVYSITPVFTRRSVVKLKDRRLERKIAHWQGIVNNACEQSGRRRLPHLHRPCLLNEWFDSSSNTAVLLDPLSSRSLKELKPANNEIRFLVGPEGGFDPQEREQAYASGCTGITLGPRILRTETAPLAAIAAAQVLWGDM